MRKDANPAKENIRDPYYEKISERFGKLQVVLYVTLFCFIVVFLITNYQLITYQNISAFVRDLRASTETSDVLHADSVIYPADDSQSFTLYRQGLAVAGKSNVTLFTAGGRKTVEETVDYRIPTAVGNGKYLLVYDLCDVSYSLYNSYMKVYEGKSNAPIRSAATSENGVYVLATGDGTCNSAVEIYRNQFQISNRYTYGFSNGSGVVLDVDVNEDGSQVAVLTSKEADAKLQTLLHIYQLGNDGNFEIYSESAVGDGLGLSCRFAENGLISVLFRNELRFLTVNGILQKQYSFGESDLSSVEYTADGWAFLLQTKKSSGKSVMVLDKNGGMLYHEFVDGSCSEISRCKDSLFLKTAEEIIRISLKDRKKAILANTTFPQKMIALDETGVMLCYRGKAICYRLTF